MDKMLYFAFFLEDKSLKRLPLNASTQKIDILEGNHDFDMRKLHSYSLIDPD
jgi:hypothetical protein